MADDERAPLIQTVRVAPKRQRYPHTTLRRFCTIALSASLVVVLILFLLPLAGIHPHRKGHGHKKHKHKDGAQKPTVSWSHLGYEELQAILLETPDEKKAEEWSRYYTAGPHLAGKNLSQAVWTKEKWQEFGVTESSVVAYDIYINYHKDHKLTLLQQGKAESKDDYKVLYEATLTEDVLKEDQTSQLENRVPTYHGYSASGNVTGQYVWVNYGTYEDFQDLVKANVSLEGKIALAKYGGIFRGLKVKFAQEHGMIGVVIYTDTEEDGEMTEENGYKPYPEGPARQDSSVQRGSVQFLSVAPGDPTTPGYPSKPGVPRVDPKGSIPSIPSLPISYRDALPILKALNGAGPNASEVNENWKGGGLRYKGVDYNIGPSPEGVLLNLFNDQEYVTTPLWNVIGVINGTLSDEVVILGNHRDAWIAGGAGDPNSGSAALNEVVRSFGKALEKGWKPLRTIVFASWDGEEYGLIGSTEWVEEYLPWLSKSAVTYLNVDVGARGRCFSASASPLLNGAIYEATALVQSPNQTVKGQTVRDTWNGHISTMGSGSDFTAFQDFAGVPSLDYGFGACHDDPVYHYHSNYDSFDWMARYGDPGFHYHATMAKVLAVTAANLVESPLIQFNTTDYAGGLQRYLQQAKDTAAIDDPFLFQPLEIALNQFHGAAVAFEAEVAALQVQLGEHVPWWKIWRKLHLLHQVHRVNAKYKYLERQFLYEPGLDGRSWFKHVVYAPGINTGYAGATYPGLVEAIAAKDWAAVYRWLGIIEGIVYKAMGLLKK